MRRLAKLFSLLVVPLLIVGAGCNKTNPVTTTSSNTNEEEIKIGYVGPLTGDVAAIGENMLLGAQVAIDEINEAGGIKGRKVKLIAEDGKCDGKSAMSAATKLIESDKVVAIIGGVCSGETLAIAPLANNSKLPLISGGSTNPSITNSGDYVFRFVPSDNFQGKHAADYIVNKLGKKKVAILYSQTDWSTGVREAFKTSFATLGGELVADEGFKADSRDLRSEITKIKAVRPDVLYFLSYTDGAVTGFNQMKKLGFDIPIIGGDAFDDPKIPEQAGANANGVRYFYAANKALPQTFIDKMAARSGGKEIIVYTPRVYDIAKALAKIIADVGTDGETIKNELYKINNFQGIADNYTLDENGDVATANYAMKEYFESKSREVK